MSIYKTTVLGCFFACLTLLACGANDDDKQPVDPAPQPEETDQPTVVSNPPLLSKNAQGEFELIVAYKNNQLYNPITQSWDTVSLRGYLTKSNLFNGKKSGDMVTDVLVGPQIRAKQGETLSIKLNNQLPIEAEETCPSHIENINQGHCFNTTNLHTHGLWVSPQGNSDNVFLKIKPEQQFNYQFKIEDDHPAGTYWYHSHVHGSTAIQVSSGMAGPLIIEGQRKPSYINGSIASIGDMDILWKDNKTQSYPNEKVMVFQQIQYSCDKKNKSSSSDQCENGLENYNLIGSPTSWGETNRTTSINGKILGEIKVNQNQYDRWRMIHGGIRDTIGLIIKELPDSEKFTAEETIAACSKYQSKDQKTAFEQLKSVTMNTIAQDGLTMDHIQKRTLSIFQPGYRHDAMIAFPTTNKHCVYDMQLNHDDQVNGPTNPRLRLAPTNINNAQLIAWVNVAPSSLVHQSAGQYLKDQAQKIGLDPAILNQLAEHDLSAFTDHPSLMTSEIDEKVNQSTKQFSAFSLTFSNAGPKFALRHSPDGKPLSFGDHYAEADAVNNQYIRKLKVGETEEWEITSDFAGHPFHIHVNPFQIVKILDRKGNDVSTMDYNIKDVEDNGTVDVQYRGLKGVYKDTIFVKQGYRVFVRTSYKKFEGDFVMHCHILDHEDQGMMETVRICGDKFPCDSAPAGHHH
jgi:L-ascorbate oxidase